MASVDFPDDSGPKISTIRPRGQAADAEREVERQRAGGDRLDPDVAPLAEPHDRALAELLLDLAEGHVECLVTFHLEPLSLPCGGVAVSVGGSARSGTYRGGVTATPDSTSWES